jgi:F-type H+-transporting ATPase subunit a
VATEGAFHIDPISQFAIKPLFELHVGGYNLAYTNSAFFMSLAVALVAAFFLFSSKQRDLIPTRLQAAGEMAYEGIANMVRENAGMEAMRYFPAIFSLFFLVLLGNLLGMIPGSFTFTSHIIVTFTLAIVLFTLITLLGFVRHGTHFITRFMPKGVPFVIAILIFVLELLSYLVRPFTLAVRLFANMLAGHMILKVFAYFVVGLVTSGSLGLMMFGIVPLAMTIALIMLEFFVAVLQAFIFTILTCVYLRDALVIEH